MTRELTAPSLVKVLLLRDDAVRAGCRPTGNPYRNPRERRWLQLVEDDREPEPLASNGPPRMVWRTKMSGAIK
jgi:hypothetical protein